jgi:hypothetical protein
METISPVCPKGLPVKVFAGLLSGRMSMMIGSPSKGWKTWTMHKRPAHMTFTGESAWDIIKPDGSEWVLLIDSTGRPMFHGA